MIITVASGKGGTGKTTVAVALAMTLAETERVTLMDADVEEPNAHLFLHPHITKQESFGILIPHVDEQKCKLSGECARVCQFHAIAVLGQHVMVFPELCHGCGSCTLACPEQAIHEEPSPIGTIETGVVENPPMDFMRGTLDVGEASATPMIRELKHRIGVEGITIVDAPPGNSCPVVESMRQSDFVILVTEPTPFGLHDLKSAVQIARGEMNLPAGVVVNRDGIGDDGVDRFCAENSIPIILRIPMDRRIAEAYSDGISLVKAFPEYRNAFLEMYRRIEQEVAA